MAVKNICDCPNPPGGRATCEPHQLAICRVRGGVSETDCVDPPNRILRLLRDAAQEGRLSPAAARRVQLWALEVITGRRRLLFQALSARDAQILSRGLYRNDDTGELVAFRLPVVAREEPGPLPARA